MQKQIEKGKDNKKSTLADVDKLLYLKVFNHMTREKSRHFTFLLYPDGEGFPHDWEERLEKIECQ